MEGLIQIQGVCILFLDLLNFTIGVLKDLSSEPKINSKLFIEKTWQAPKVDWAGEDGGVRR